MAKNLIHGSNRVCATCDRFVCERKVLPGKFVETYDNEGKCYLINRVTGIVKGWAGGCNEWSPWGPIR